MLDEHTLGLPCNTQESLAARSENLRQEAIKYVEEGAESEHIYNVAMDALHEAIRKVAAAKMCGSAPVQTTVVNGSQQLLSCSLDEDEKIQELTAELEQASQRCEAYRTKLLCVMKDMEEWKLRISVKVQNVRLKMKD